MRPSHLLPVVGLTFGLMILAPLARGNGQPDTKQPKKAATATVADPKAPPAVTLPITRVVLFSAGVAYFHREGDINGDGRLDLRFEEGDINDLLKSLILTDKDGGKVRAVTYDNRMPLDFMLKGFAVDVTENPTMGQLMHQMRGEKVEVADKTGVVTTGKIVSVERQPPPAMGPDPGELLNLLTEDGLQTVELKQLKRIKLVRPELQAEFNKALEMLATARGDNKKAVSVVFSGNGKRKVAVGYVVEAPLWKPSYRLSVDEKGATRIQGWATVENTTDEDWTNVKVGLVAGRPMSFQMDLYDPLFVPRPMVEPDLFASLRPPMYQGGLNPTNPMMGMAMGNNGGNPLNNNPLNMGAFGNGGNQFGNQGAFGNGANQIGQQNLGFGGGQFGQLGGQFGLQGGGYGNNFGNYLPRVARPNIRDLQGDRLSYAEYVNRLRGNPTPPNGEEKPKPPAVRDPLDKQAGALAAADGALGDMYEYTIEEPITLAKQKSALLPLVNATVEGGRVSIFNANTLAKHPLLGLKLTNKTKLHLAAGPVAVYDSGTFAGDARMPDIKPNETRLVSYAIDLGTEVVSRTESKKPTLLAVTKSEARVTLESTRRRTTTYEIRNRNPQDRVVIIEHPQTSNWKLITPTKPDDRTRSFYRFEVPTKSGALATLEVTEESPAADSHTLVSAREGLFDAEVVIQVEDKKPEVLSVGLADGKVTLSNALKRITTYTIRNRDTADRTVAIEHLQTKGWKLVSPGKPVEGRGFYQFNLPVKTGSFATLEVIESSTDTDVRKLADVTRDNLQQFSLLKETPPAVREVFKKMLDLRVKVDEAQKGIAVEQDALKEIGEDQERLRKNIERAPKESETFKRYLKKFDDQETEIEKRQARVRELKMELAKHEKALKEFAETVKAE